MALRLLFLLAASLLICVISASDVPQQRPHALYHDFSGPEGSDLVFGSSDPLTNPGLNGFVLPSSDLNDYYCFNTDIGPEAYLYVRRLSYTPPSVEVTLLTWMLGSRGAAVFKIQYAPNSPIWWTEGTCNDVGVALKAFGTLLGPNAKLAKSPAGFKSRIPAARMVWRQSKVDKEKEYRWIGTQACRSDFPSSAETTLSLYYKGVKPSAWETTAVCQQAIHLYNVVDDAVGVQAENKIFASLQSNYPLGGLFTSYPELVGTSIKGAYSDASVSHTSLYGASNKLRTSWTPSSDVSHMDGMAVQPMIPMAVRPMDTVAEAFNVGIALHVIAQRMQDNTELGIVFKQLEDREAVVAEMNEYRDSMSMSAGTMSIKREARINADEETGLGGSLDVEKPYIFTPGGQVAFLSNIVETIFYATPRVMRGKDVIKLGSLDPEKYGVYSIPFPVAVFALRTTYKIPTTSLELIAQTLQISVDSLTKTVAISKQICGAASLLSKFSLADFTSKDPVGSNFRGVRPAESTGTASAESAGTTSGQFIDVVNSVSGEEDIFNQERYPNWNNAKPFDKLGSVASLFTPDATETIDRLGELSRKVSVAQRTDAYISRHVHDLMRVDLCVNSVPAIAKLLEKSLVARFSESTGWFDRLQIVHDNLLTVYASAQIVLVATGHKVMASVVPNFASVHLAGTESVALADRIENADRVESADRIENADRIESADRTESVHNIVGADASNLTPSSQASVLDHPTLTALALVSIRPSNSEDGMRFFATGPGSRLDKKHRALFFLFAAASTLSSLDVQILSDTIGIERNDPGFELLHYPYESHNEFLDAVGNTAAELYSLFEKHTLGALFNPAFVFDATAPQTYVRDLMRSAPYTSYAIEKFGWPRVYLPSLILYGVPTSLVGSQHSVGAMAQFLGDALRSHGAGEHCKAFWPRDELTGLESEDFEDYLDSRFGSDSLDDDVGVEEAFAFGSAMEWFMAPFTGLGKRVQATYAGLSVEDCVCVSDGVLHILENHVPFRHDFYAQRIAALAKFVALAALHREPIGLKLSQSLLRWLFEYNETQFPGLYMRTFVAAFSSVYMRHQIHSQGQLIDALRVLQTDLMGVPFTSLSELVVMEGPHIQRDPVSTNILSQAVSDPRVGVEKFAAILVGNSRYSPNKKNRLYSVYSSRLVPSGAFSPSLWGYRTRSLWFDRSKKWVVIHDSAVAEDLVADILFLWSDRTQKTS